MLGTSAGRVSHQPTQRGRPACESDRRCARLRGSMSREQHLRVGRGVMEQWISFVVQKSKYGTTLHSYSKSSQSNNKYETNKTQNKQKQKIKNEMKCSLSMILSSQRLHLARCRRRPPVLQGVLVRAQRSVGRLEGGPHTSGPRVRHMRTSIKSAPVMAGRSAP